MLDRASLLNEDYFVAAQLEKYETDYPIWIALEGMDFATLIDFYEFCCDATCSAQVLDIEALHRVRILRNMCAHNSLLLPSMGYKAQEALPGICTLTQACADLMSLLDRCTPQLMSASCVRKLRALTDMLLQLSGPSAKASYSYKDHSLELAIPKRLQTQFRYIYKKVASTQVQATQNRSK